MPRSGRRGDAGAGTRDTAIVHGVAAGGIVGRRAVAVRAINQIVERARRIACGSSLFHGRLLTNVVGHLLN